MSFISKVPIQRDIPVDIAGEPGQWMKFCKLSAKKLQKAADAVQFKMFKDVPTEAVVAILSNAKRKKKKQKKGADDTIDPLALYDAATLLKLSLHSWSHSTPPGDDPSDQIDKPTLDWAALDIYELSQPPTKADLKNSASVSTSP